MIADAAHAAVFGCPVQDGESDYQTAMRERSAELFRGGK
jgi:hypothetical protein